MSTQLFIHKSFQEHDTGHDHPESSARILAVEKALTTPEFASIIRNEAPCASEDQIRLIHPQQHIDRILTSVPKSGHQYVDGDTILSSASGEAGFRAVGAVCKAVDNVCSQQTDNAFCLVRPPGHHAEPQRAMGFCLFNNIAIAAQYARKTHGLDKVAIVDFDVHHGNGTQAAFYHDPNVVYASTHQSPLYPGTGSRSETGVGNIFNAPLRSGNGRKEFEAAMEELIFPALHKFIPDLLLISAGFDAHRDDPLASLNFVEEDFAWVTRQLRNIAEKYCEGRLISVLEGGYNLAALANSASVHVKELMA